MMKNLLLLLSFLMLMNCGLRKTVKSEQTEKLSENIEASKEGVSQLNIDRTGETLTKEVSGKMQLSIVSKHDSSNLDSPCTNQRKILVKDSQGNSAEMTLNANEDINFNSESNYSESLQKYTEALSEYISAKESYQKAVDQYQSIKSKQTESDRYDPWLLAVIGLFIYLTGMATIPLVKTFINSKIKLKS